MDNRYWVGFNLVKGIGAVRLQALRDHFGDLAVAWQAPLEALQAAGLSLRLAERVAQIRVQVDLEMFLARIGSQGIQILTWEDELYPARLKEIDQPPPVLYVRGSLTAEDAWRVGLVQQIADAGTVLDAARAIAADITRLSPVSVQLTKQLIDGASGDGLAAALEGIAGALAGTTRDAAEGLASFREKRAAHYEGR